METFITIIIVDHIQRRRKFQGIDFEKGSPNLIVTESGKHNVYNYFAK